MPSAFTYDRFTLSREGIKEGKCPGQKREREKGGKRRELEIILKNRMIIPCSERERKRDGTWRRDRKLGSADPPKGKEGTNDRNREGVRRRRRRRRKRC